MNSEEIKAIVDRHGFKAVVEQIQALYQNQNDDRRLEVTWLLSTESGAWVDEQVNEQQKGNFYDEY